MALPVEMEPPRDEEELAAPDRGDPGRAGRARATGRSQEEEEVEGQKAPWTPGARPRRRRAARGGTRAAVVVGRMNFWKEMLVLVRERELARRMTGGWSR